MALGLSKVKGIDYAWEHVSVNALVRWGATFVCRYISKDPGKDESLAEATALADAGIWSTLVYETTARRADASRSAGTDDARAALLRCSTLEVPADRPVYFAVDFDASGAEVAEYFHGIRTVLGHRTGVYGGYRAVKYLFDHGLVDWAWQTYAWSSGQWDPRAQLQQFQNDITVGGVGCDADRAMKEDYGQWMPGHSPTPAPPAPTPNDSEEDDMPNGLLRTGKNAVTPINIKRGAYDQISFGADETLEFTGAAPVELLRVAIHDKDGWKQVAHGVKVSSRIGQTVIHFADPATTNIISVMREGVDGELPSGEVECSAQIAWEVSKA